MCTFVVTALRILAAARSLATKGQKLTLFSYGRMLRSNFSAASCFAVTDNC